MRLPSIKLVPISEEEFPAYSAEVYRSYAKDKAISEHLTFKQATALAEQIRKADIPNGFDSAGHFFYHMKRPDGATVGTLWLAIYEEEPEYAYVYDIVVFSIYRRRGYAQKALKLAEGKARKQGCNKIMLNVFDFNQQARALYRKIGYHGSALLSKKL